MSNNDNLANVQSTDELHIKLSAKNINISNFDLTCCIIIMFFFSFFTRVFHIVINLLQKNSKCLLEF